MTATGTSLSDHLSDVATKPLAHGSAAVAKVNDTLRFKTRRQGSTAAGKDLSHTQWSAFDFTAEIEHFRLSFEVLNVLEKYGRHVSPKALCSNLTIGTESSSPAWIGKNKFLSHVYQYVRQRQQVQLTLPAFPCKSLNRVNKVLGHLPDLGEELALSRLHAIGKDIEKVYAPGAQVNIATDGVLFNDIIGITDEDCWDYGEALKAIIVGKGLTSLKLTQCMSLIGILSDKDINRETYLANIEFCRRELERRFAPSEEVLTNLIKSDKDTGLTYCGMMKFLESEMETSPDLAGQARNAKKRVFKKVAKRMMQRSEAFTLAIRTLRPDHVRLSMHPSSGSVKLSIPLIPRPDGDFQKSPWHSCIAVGVDGRYRCVHAGEVKNSHDLIYRHGRPYFYRERSHLFDWGPGQVDFEPRYPHGTLIHPRVGAEGAQVDLEKVKALASAQSVVMVKGFVNFPDGRVIL